MKVEIFEICEGFSPEWAIVAWKGSDGQQISSGDLL